MLVTSSIKLKYGKALSRQIQLQQTAAIPIVVKQLSKHPESV